MTKKKDNRGGAGRNQGRKKSVHETSTFTIRTRKNWVKQVKQAAKDKEAELKALENKN